jgi:hypothetical protein
MVGFQMNDDEIKEFGSGCGLFEVFAYTDWGNVKKKKVMIVGIPTEIVTKHLSNTV